MPASRSLALFANLPKPVQWFALLLMSGLVTISLEFVHLPAALMLGPMVAGILMETGGGSVRVPYIPLNAAQAVIGCMIGRSITPTTIEEFGDEWSLFLGVVSIIVVASSALGYLLSRLRVLSGTTAVWGLLPGAAPAMIFMAEAFGADFRLVAFMQYLRVVLVAVAASAIALLWMPPNLGAAAAHSTVMFPEMHIGAFAVTLCVASVSLVLVGHR
jgi:membrane AbrB-like protein